jgi:hypothetical protein
MPFTLENDMQLQQKHRKVLQSQLTSYRGIFSGRVHQVLISVDYFSLQQDVEQ